MKSVRLEVSVYEAAKSLYAPTVERLGSFILSQLKRRHLTDREIFLAVNDEEAVELVRMTSLWYYNPGAAAEKMMNERIVVVRGTRIPFFVWRIVPAEEIWLIGAGVDEEILLSEEE